MTQSPYIDCLDIVESTDADGHVLCVMEPNEHSLGREGVMHGGATAALLESAGKAVVRRALTRGGTADDAAIDTLSLTVDYLRAGKSIRSFARGRVLKLGTRVANVFVEAWTDDPSKPFAAAKITFGLTR